jgi:hypothetical protein
VGIPHKGFYGFHEMVAVRDDPAANDALSINRAYERFFHHLVTLDWAWEPLREALDSATVLEGKPRFPEAIRYSTPVPERLASTLEEPRFAHNEAEVTPIPPVASRHRLDRILRKSVVLTSVLFIAVLALLVFRLIRRPATVETPPTTRSQPPPKINTIGYAEISKTTTANSGLVLNQGTTVQLVGPLPPESEWDLQRQLQVEIDNKLAFVSLGSLSRVKTDSAKFDLWHARQSCTQPELCLEQIEVLYQNLDSKDDSILIFLAEAYARRAYNNKDAASRAKADKLLAGVENKKKFQNETRRIRSLLSRSDISRSVEEDYPNILARARSAKEKGDCRTAVELANKALALLNPALVATSEPQRIKNECGQ